MERSKLSSIEEPGRCRFHKERTTGARPPKRQNRTQFDISNDLLHLNSVQPLRRPASPASRSAQPLGVPKFQLEIWNDLNYEIQPIRGGTHGQGSETSAGGPLHRDLRPCRHADRTA
ncbi:protein of unknown function [Aminobacter niigataensis]|nr:protein of unknown function [Aminobacter niigataensis]